MKILISHPSGNSNVRAIAKGFLTQGLLYQFHTSIAVFPNNFWHKIANFKGLGDIKRRSYDSGLQSYTEVYPINELGRMIASKLSLHSLTKAETGIFCVDRVYQNLDRKISRKLQSAKKNGLTAVYAYEDGALETFKAAKKLGLECIYDLPIAYHTLLQELLHEEALRKPNWAFTLGGGINDSNQKLERKRKELELADTIVVASDFVRESLPEWAKDKKVIQSPFGTPFSSNQFDLQEKNTNKRLRVLFVGSMTQRKGLGDLFDAIKLVDSSKVELVVLGSLAAPLSFYSDQVQFTYEPTRSHDKVLELMRSCDVFCLPSIVEGRALVIQEAMSQGLPIIITPNTGAEDLVEAEETGFLVPIRNPEAISEKINWFLDNRSKIFQMGKKAKQLADTYSWDNYASKICNVLNSKSN
ncbi:glycosyltransferase family 4 protein [Flavobacterium johnsoniae]|uniref:glycosyltransferase family 4 protein n=1 Tax=Flavobacterium johnsoniae TaxID=986 RepID=UPI0025B0DA26|nr:glycosyltransferase family 4 protein [Flavobacterium johnsoniae]WJS94218.1 glycosyltransferase family 4 protein [Flavobacterium johnsoniae]